MYKCTLKHKCVYPSVNPKVECILHIQPVDCMPTRTPTFICTMREPDEVYVDMYKCTKVFQVNNYSLHVQLPRPNNNINKTPTLTRRLHKTQPLPNTPAPYLF